jgi:hypothetical protein
MIPDPRLILHFGDLTDATNLIRIIQEVQPDEIYNLAAQSHVQVSFETPEYTANSDGLGTLRLLEAIRILGLDRRRHALLPGLDLGALRQGPGGTQRETTPFYPRSPYAAAKLYAYWITVNYREAYGVHASNGILFNHESPIRGETFVTRKITRAVAAIHLGLQEASSRQSRRASRLGPCARLRRGDVAYPPAGDARRLRAGDGRDAHRAQLRREGVRRDRHEHRLARARASTRWGGAPGPARSACGRSALLPADRGRPADRRCLEGPGAPRLAPPDHARRAGAEMVAADLSLVQREHNRQYRL